MSTWTPHDYQRKAMKKMLSQRAVGLFMDPGLGKTSTVLGAFRLLKEEGLVKNMLIIAPLRPVYSVWPEEMGKWLEFNGLSYSILHGPKKDSAVEEDTDIHIINPEGLKWLGHRGFPTYDVLCIDESTKFKNSQAQRFKLLKKYLNLFKLRWILTGTPAPNGIQDLFAQIYLLDQGRSLGKYITHFRNKFMFQSDYLGYNWELKPGAYEEISEKIAPLVVQLTAEDYLDMPELIRTTVEVELPPSAMRIYREVEEEFLAALEEGLILAANAGAAGTKCRQIANGAVYAEGSDDEWLELHDAKLEALEELMDELGSKPLLLLYEYRHDAARIKRLLGDRVMDISGASPTKGAKMIEQFNSGQLPVLMGHPASMGHGLNLQGVCHHVVFFGITWNLEYYDQAFRRVYRQGQQNEHVILYHIVAKDTRDERVMRVLGEKDADQRMLLSAIGKD